MIILRYDLVIVVRAGAVGWEQTEAVFERGEEVRQLVNHKIDHRGTGKAISEANPRINAQLEDGSRLHAVMSPVTVLQGPVVTIRRFRSVIHRMEDFVTSGHMSPGPMAFLRSALKARLSIAVI